MKGNMSNRRLLFQTVCVRSTKEQRGTLQVTEKADEAVEAVEAAEAAEAAEAIEAAGAADVTVIDDAGEAAEAAEVTGGATTSMSGDTTSINGGTTDITTPVTNIVANPNYCDFDTFMFSFVVITIGYISLCISIIGAVCTCFWSGSDSDDE
jgi:hypothetical protein